VWVLEKADTERRLLESITYRKLEFFGHVIRKPDTCRGKRNRQARNKSRPRGKTTHNLASQHQELDKAIVGGNSEGNGGPFTVEEDCPGTAGEGQRTEHWNRTVYDETKVAYVTQNVSRS